MILHLYEEYGTELLSRLHGMFAFALLDERDGTLFVARDRLGKKPVVYAQTRQGVAIASEATAASTSDTPSGINTVLRSGSTTYSAYPPSVAAPIFPRGLRHNVSRPARHCLHCPQVR